jgi:hypothetical protein
VAYKVSLAPPVDREARIAAAIAASTKTEEFYDFRGTKVSLPVVRLPVGVPVYRMENFRTFSEQAEYCAREAKSRDFFLSGQENESAQQVQHDILVQLAKKGNKSVVPVIEVLEREGQRESLLVTHRGMLVNGNRRLAAMRELYARDPGTFASFGHVDCKVLPADTTPADILQIEAVLQAKPETRLDYDWIGDAQLLSALMKLLGSTEAVAQRLGRKKGEVQNTLQALAEADLYLKDWAGTPGQYKVVADEGEQLFADLPTQISGKSAALAEASRVIAWSLFDNRTRIEGRLYGYNVAFGKRAEDVLERLAEELDVSSVPEVDAGGSELEFEIDAEPSSANYRPLIEQLKNAATRDRAVDALIEVCTSVVESEKDKKSGNAALKAVTAAHARLAEVDLSRASPDTFDSIVRQLESVSARTAALQQKMTTMLDALANAKVEAS